jgi:hypothetical protein
LGFAGVADSVRVGAAVRVLVELGREWNVGGADVEGVTR